MMKMLAWDVLLLADPQQTKGLKLIGHNLLKMVPVGGLIFLKICQTWTYLLAPIQFTKSESDFALCKY